MVDLVRMAFMVAAIAALSGCVFGDEPKQEQPPWPWADENCVPAECMFQCCEGWNYSQKPTLHEGNIPPEVCKGVPAKIPAYSDYVTLVLQENNFCPEDLRQFESGYCYDIQPTDVIKRYDSNKQPVYLNAYFAVCPPRGQFMASPLEDVELTPKE